MQGKYVRWLLGELDGLVKEGILEPPAAERLRQHYREKEGDPGRWRELAFAVLGALLVGGGVILLLAHNWSDLSRPVRTVISFLPLLLTQALAAYTLLRHRESAAWREGVGIALSLAVASSIALIGQTYHIPGDLEAFLLTWALLILPVVYVLGAITPAALYLGVSLAWAFTTVGNGREAGWLWGLLALVGPFLLRHLRSRSTGGRQLLGWVAAIVLALAVGPTFLDQIPAFQTVFFALVFAWLWLEGEHQRQDGRSWLLSPFSLVGGLTVVGHALVLSFGEGWVIRSPRMPPLGDQIAEAWPLLLVAAAGACRWAWLALGEGRSGRLASLAVGLWFLVVLPPTISAVGFGRWDDDAYGLWASAYLALVGLVALREGFRRESAGWANVGLGVLALLIVFRFFDSNLPLLFRGLAFVAVGVAFLVANRILSRRLRAAEGGGA